MYIYLLNTNMDVQPQLSNRSDKIIQYIPFGNRLQYRYPSLVGSTLYHALYQTKNKFQSTIKLFLIILKSSTISVLSVNSNKIASAYGGCSFSWNYIFPNIYYDMLKFLKWRVITIVDIYNGIYNTEY